ncbi:cob(I)yrinic acid a,c-diamide adenosyltransferase [Clostridium botulinum]|uniref:Cobinamide adenolsyltransferase n=1 Tax=Clostridium botulinum C/D str. DC5 TaxID=1443128 RepID=A0A0A0IJW2_CLOBO|nr:cob(I)yrinic acid a,c-diamide adenosyltransferase [Clostridium botulinum]KEI01760.1 cobinamide adenolsyltransferase [Clostridium botulinum C/D str. BKT75002]KEI07424.1 cobinamide adenolsyltransferase [Clostridium botulinum C/D str. BKT2873]KGM93285.1 cobinamide adenolsyltransferase [Clostridium botulinum D str. CCUG 7971]KGM99845.1 cobinamide adenolsyltransferase [Clostridium botulinum C/D str. DC5]KOC49343.1 cobinamide adenolsyltransferase [Clostridium botulinum]
MQRSKGYIHVYTGNGKGKTTCALGLSLRAVCAGKKVFFGQFVKGMKYSELEAVKYLPGFEMKQYGRNCFIFNNPSKEDINIAKEGLKDIEDILKKGDYDIVVMDELNIALYYKLFSIEEVIKILDNRKENVEVIITGRYASNELINKADLVTEMKEIKHYYSKGVEAREGIEK